MERLKIEWHRAADNHSEGFMELNLDTFFPCTVKKANKVFTLVRRWCSLETIADLEKYFLQKVKEWDEKIECLKQEIDDSQFALEKHQYVVNAKQNNTWIYGRPLSDKTYNKHLNEIESLKKEIKHLEKSLKSSQSTACKYQRMLRLFYAHTSDLHTHTHTQMKGSDE